MGKSSVITITFLDCSARYGLSATDLQEFVDLGLLQLADEADTLSVKPDLLARLARLHHELGLTTDSIDIVLTMRRRMLKLQTELALQRARVAQLERYLQGSGPLLDI
jgi:chaperone modulatory protein CbpM